MSNAERILAILSRVAQTDEVKDQPDLELYELAILDSLRTVELMAAFSAELGVEVSPAELEREEWATPARIVRYIEGRLGHCGRAVWSRCPREPVRQRAEERHERVDLLRVEPRRLPGMAVVRNLLGVDV